MAVERTGDELRNAPMAESDAAVGREERHERIIKLIVADRLRRQREAMGLSQKHVAVAVGVDYSTYSRWENPKHRLLPGLENLKELAETLNVTTDNLLGRAERLSASTAEIQLLAAVRALRAHDRAYVEDLLQRLQQPGPG